MGSKSICLWANLVSFDLLGSLHTERMRTSRSTFENSYSFGRDMRRWSLTDLAIPHEKQVHTSRFSRYSFHIEILRQLVLILLGREKSLPWHVTRADGSALETLLIARVSTTCPRQKRNKFCISSEMS